MDTHTTVIPTQPVAKSLMSTVVKCTASQPHRTPRHAQEPQVQLTASEQVKRGLKIHFLVPPATQLRVALLNIFLSFSGLCAPTNITVSPACEDSAVSWSHVTGAEMYIATATADDGHTHTCSSNYSNSCNFTDLHCGETYAVTVVTVDGGCWSEPSSMVQLRAGERKL